jgi:Tfp pilus assembly protein PilP
MRRGRGIGRACVARFVAGAALLAGLAAVSGCGDDEASFNDRSKAFGTKAGATSAPSIGPSTDTKAGKAAAAEIAKLAAVPKPGSTGGKKPRAVAKVYNDKELEAIAAYVVAPEPPMDEAFFAEAIDNRDPFRPYVPEALPIDKGGPKPIVADCVLSAYSVDELKLAGIISGIAVPRATFIDPGGTGWTVKKGECLGRTGGRITRMAGDEMTLLEVSPATGSEVERIIKLHPGAIDLRKAMKGGDPTVFRPEPKPAEATDSLGVVPEPAGVKPPIEVGMSKANFLKNYGKCFSKRIGAVVMGGSAAGEVYGRSSTVGECADIIFTFVSIDSGVVKQVLGG